MNNRKLQIIQYKIIKSLYYSGVINFGISLGLWLFTDIKDITIIILQLLSLNSILISKVYKDI